MGPADRAAHRAREARRREREKAEGGGGAKAADANEEDDLLAWTWDPEAKGPWMRVEDQGSSVALRGGGGSSERDEVAWEYKFEPVMNLQRTFVD